MGSFASHLRFAARVVVPAVLAVLMAFGQASETLDLYKAMTDPKIAVDLSRAVEAGYVEADYKALGGASGPTVLVTVTKRRPTGDLLLFFSVPTGLRLENPNGSEQEMVVAGVLGRPTGGTVYSGGREVQYIPSEHIVLDAAPVTYLLEAYCAEFHKENPSRSTMFRTKAVDPTLACILKGSHLEGLTLSATQAAVWQYTDGVSLDAMRKKFPVTDGEWTSARSVVDRCAGAGSILNDIHNRPSGAVVSPPALISSGPSVSYPPQPQARIDFETARRAYDAGDNATALRLWQNLAEQGDAPSEVSLGTMYYLGRGVPRDYSTAVLWIRSAATQGFAPAQGMLGLLYKMGEGVPQDFTEAARWIRMAAYQGNPLAQTDLGALYEQGTGVPQDLAEAAKWYGKAAEKGLPKGQASLGRLYSLGRGVPQDNITAYYWLSAAAKHGLRQAAEDLERLSARMSRAEIDRARDFVPVPEIESNPATTRNSNPPRSSSVQNPTTQVGSAIQTRNVDTFEFKFRKTPLPYRISDDFLIWLKKCDGANKRYSMEIYANGRLSTLADKTINAPITFYVWNAPEAFELVVNAVGDDYIVGYVVAGKNAHISPQMGGSPTEAAHHYKEAVQLVRQGKIEEGGTEIRLAAVLDPAFAGRYYYNLGAICVNAGQLEPTGRAFKQAIEADPNYADAHYQYGMYLLGKATPVGEGRFAYLPATKEELETYLRLKPDGPYVNSARGALSAIERNAAGGR